MPELPKDQAMIVKVINVVGRTKHGNDTIGFIVYERSFSDSYVMNEDSETDKFKKLLSPEKEERFPLDELDNIILDAVQSKFPESFFKSYLIFAGNGKSKYEHYLKNPKETAIFIVDPDISGVDTNLLVGKSFDDFKEGINIYQNYAIEDIKGHYFRTERDYKRHETITQELRRIKFL